MALPFFLQWLIKTIYSNTYCLLLLRGLENGQRDLSVWRLKSGDSSEVDVKNTFWKTIWKSIVNVSSVLCTGHMSMWIFSLMYVYLLDLLGCTLRLWISPVNGPVPLLTSRDTSLNKGAVEREWSDTYTVYLGTIKSRALSSQCVLLYVQTANYFIIISKGPSKTDLLEKGDIFMQSTLLTVWAAFMQLYMCTYICLCLAPV